MDFFSILKCSLFFLLIKLQEEFPPVKYHLCWICSSNKNKALKTINFCFSVIFWNLLCSKFWNHFQTEINPGTPCLFDFLTAFYMIWKYEDSWKSWLVGFWVITHSRMQKISVNNFFSFLSFYYGFTTYFEKLNFAFSNIILTVVWTCKILTF